MQESFELHSRMSSMLWNAVLQSRILQASEFKVARGFLPGDLLHACSLAPLDQPGNGQQVALVSGLDFERHPDASDRARAYDARPRTRVYEGIDVRSPDWYSLVSLQLARLARCRVVCSMYESSRSDDGLSMHSDAWHGLVLQMRGEKVWKLGGDQRQETVTLRAGDLLIVPEGMPHAVQTPDYSVHLVFALIRSEPFSNSP